MRLIEKECPNCGAGLSFTKEDTSCKCEYCKREFEIERDTDKKKLADQFTLSELKTPFKIFSYLTIGSFVTQAVIFLITFLIIIIVAFNIVKGLNDSNSIFNRNSILVTSINDLTTSDYATIDINSKVVYSKKTIGTTRSFITRSNLKRVNMYIVYNEKSNYIIPVYKATYENIYNSDESCTIYIPIQYKNVYSKNDSIAFSINEGEIIAPEYYFNSEHSEYSYGYSDLDTLYNEAIKKYEKNYKIIKK